MFHNASQFNQPLDNWDVSNVNNMVEMFHYSIEFNQSLGSWNFSNVSSLGAFISFTNMNTTNYDALLLNWVNSGIENIYLGADEVQFCDQVSRDLLVNDRGWSIFDGGLASTCNLGIEEFSIDNYVDLYPNPADDGVFLKKKSNIQLKNSKLYNMRGQELINIQGDIGYIDTRNMTSGLYLLKIETNQGNLQKKIVIK
jgi:surface protein